MNDFAGELYGDDSEGNEELFSGLDDFYMPTWTEICVARENNKAIV